MATHCLTAGTLHRLSAHRTKPCPPGPTWPPSGAQDLQNDSPMDDPHVLAACFVTHLSWTSVSDFAALAVAFAADLEPERADLSAPARRRLTLWRETPHGLGSARAAASQIEGQCARLGADVLHPFHSDYPSALQHLAKPPVFLSRVADAAPWRRRATISVFGSREPSQSALSWMDAHLPEFCSAVDVCVASGGARGIDRRSHALAIANSRPTVMFLPSGLGAPYPADLREWFAGVRSGGGAVLSEFPPLQPVRRPNFERRNRMIAAIGNVAFAVEGRRQSGTMMTARMAADYGRTVCALPGSPMDPRSAGTLDLLRDGAVLIRDSADLSVLVSCESVNAMPA